MASVSQRICIVVCSSGACLLTGCQSSASFEAEAALRPGAVYTGPDVTTFTRPVSTLTVGEVAAELRAMVEMNHALADLARRSIDPLQDSRLKAINAAHTRRLGEMLDVIGWPTERVVGHQAALAACVIAEQSTQDPSFQKRCLTLMHDRLAAGELQPQRVAMLTDRVRAQKGQPQVYGSLIRLNRNEYGTLVARETAPIADPTTLDDRRIALGLDPWRHYCRKVADTAQRAQNPGLDHFN